MPRRHNGFPVVFLQHEQRSDESEGLTSLRPITTPFVFWKWYTYLKLSLTILRERDIGFRLILERKQGQATRVAPPHRTRLSSRPCRSNLLSGFLGIERKDFLSQAVWLREGPNVFLRLFVSTRSGTAFQLFGRLLEGSNISTHVRKFHSEFPRNLINCERLNYPQQVDRTFSGRIFHVGQNDTRFRCAIFRSMAASWAPRNPLVSHARVLILFAARKRRSERRSEKAARLLSRRKITAAFGSPSFGWRLLNSRFGKLSMAGGKFVLRSHPRGRHARVVLATKETRLPRYY